MGSGYLGIKSFHIVLVAGRIAGLFSLPRRVIAEPA
jgi:uncharacterized membrane protein